MKNFPTPGSSIELPAPLEPRPQIKLIVFDLDGTLSWLRHGWPGMMCDVFEPLWAAAGQGRGPAARDLLIHEILALNGHPSVKQCLRFVEMLKAAGGPELLHAEDLRDEFSRRLETAISERIASIRSGAAVAGQFVVHGAEAFLAHTQATGRTLAILSTTAQERVEEEAALLGFRKYFGRHVYGGTGDPRLFSKRAVFDRMLQEENCPGDQLLSFGDGPVELRETKALGGLGLGVCSDENENGSGRCDPHKREGLLAVGAAAIMPDYRDAAPLLDYLLAR